MTVENGHGQPGTTLVAVPWDVQHDLDDAHRSLYLASSRALEAGDSDLARRITTLMREVGGLT